MRSIIKILLITAILFVSFTPSETLGSNKALLLRVIPVVILGVLVLLGALGRIKIKMSCALAYIVFSSYGMFLNIANANIVYVLFLCVSFFTFMVALELKNNINFKDIFILSLEFIIVAWMIFLIAQVLYYLSAGSVVDIHKMVFGIDAQRIGKAGDILRMGGVHIEPGTYSNWMYGACAIRVLLKNKIFDILGMVAIFSTLITVSAWSFFAVPFYMVACVIERNSLKSSACFIVASVFSLIIFYNYFGDSVLQYLSMRSSLADDSGASKVEVYNFIYSDMLSRGLLGNSVIDTPCNECISPQDAGVLINYLFYFGFMALLVFIGFIANLRKSLGVAGIVFFIPIFFAKYNIWDPIILIIIACVLVKVAVIKNGDAIAGVNNESK